jgi:hypothetical protein
MTRIVRRHFHRVPINSNRKPLFFCALFTLLMQGKRSMDEWWEKDVEWNHTAAHAAGRVLRETAAKIDNDIYELERSRAEKWREWEDAKRPDIETIFNNSVITRGKELANQLRMKANRIEGASERARREQARREDKREEERAKLKLA